MKPIYYKTRMWCCCQVFPSPSLLSSYIFVLFGVLIYHN
jgi:hypothetical protein